MDLRMDVWAKTYITTKNGYSNLFKLEAVNEEKWQIGVGVLLKDPCTRQDDGHLREEAKQKR